MPSFLNLLQKLRSQEGRESASCSVYIDLQKCKFGTEEIRSSEIMQTESCYVKKEKTTMSSVVLLISFHEG